MSLASRAALLLALLSTPALPQASPQASKLAVSGIVRDATTGAPIPDAEVRGNSDSSGSSKTIQATTNSLGQFTLDGLDPGPTRIYVFHFFLGGSVTKIVNLTAGPEQKPVEILLRTGGHIAGHITDQEGKPLAGVSVHALRRVFVKGKLQYVSGGGDDLTRSDGQYYIDGLPAGRSYIIMAQRDEGADVEAVSDEPEDPALRKDVLAPTYYPNADAPERAIPLQLDSNDTRDQIDIRLRRSPSYCVAGTADLRSLGVGAEDTVSFALSDQRGTLGPDAKFRICDLHPGEYSLSLTPQKSRPVGTASATIIDRDVDRVTVTPLAPSLTITGKVVWEGDAPKLAQTDGFLGFELDGRVLSSLPLPQRIPINGEFSADFFPSLENAFLRVTGLPPGAYVKNILHTGSTALITMASDGARITAQAADKDGNPVAEAYIAVFPASPESQSALALSLRTGKTNSRGAWISDYLPPGRYAVLATDTLIEPSTENFSFETVEKLWLARSQAQIVELMPGATEVANLVPASLR